MATSKLPAIKSEGCHPNCTGQWSVEFLIWYLVITLIPFVEEHFQYPLQATNSLVNNLSYSLSLSHPPINFLPATTNFLRSLISIFLYQDLAPLNLLKGRSLLDLLHEVAQLGQSLILLLAGFLQRNQFVTHVLVLDEIASLDFLVLRSEILK